MTESTDASSPRDLVLAAIDAAGANDVLTEALEVAGLSALPESYAGLLAFVEGPLRRALAGTRGPEVASSIVEPLRERIFVAAQRSGARLGTPAELVRPGEPLLTDSMSATLPPPAEADAAEAYDDLVTGAVHTRVTPAWGIRVVDPDAEPGTTLWIIVSNDSTLVSEALRTAPSHVDVVHASSVAVLNGALKRSASKASVVVLDAHDPSVKLDRVVASLTTDALGLRVVLWRMSRERRELLIGAVPHAATWLPCAAEVTPKEIMQLLGL
ncbi:MAG: hypothetical protein KF729_10505 [Sandaracinaceae bacterium]|nr:hypothetical protein [Sandaracinaceae bacterium]